MTYKLLMVFISVIFFQSCHKSDDINSQVIENSHNKDILISVPLSYFYSDKVSNLFPEVKYLRTFGVDFKKSKVNGLYQYADDERVEDFINYTNENGIKVIWTLNLSSRTLDTELAYVKNLLQRGMNICAFEYGGELYLQKYALGDTTKKGVVEKITPIIYVDLLKKWLPAFLKVLPFSNGDHIIIGASHGNTNSQRDQPRKAWNLELTNLIKDSFPEIINQLSWSFHLYAGRTAVESPNGEEDIVNSLDFSFMLDFPPEMKIYVTESGYYVDDFSADELQKSWQFWSAIYQHLRAGDIYGVHPLICKSQNVNSLCIYSLDGELTPVGEQFKKWLPQRNDY